MITDAQGNALSGATVEAAMLFDDAIEGSNLYRGDPVALLDRAAIFQLCQRHAFGIANGADGTLAVARADEPDIGVGLVDLIQRCLDQVRVGQSRVEFLRQRRELKAVHGRDDGIAMQHEVAEGA